MRYQVEVWIGGISGYVYVEADDEQGAKGEAIELVKESSIEAVRVDEAGD